MDQRFVIDTNGWVSLFHKRVIEDFIDCIIENDITIFSCNELISEFKDIHAKHPVIQQMLPNKTNAYVQVMLHLTETFEPKKRVRFLNDYKDNYLADLAYQTKSVLVTNDKGFAIIKKLASTKIEIITLGQFYNRIGFTASG